MKNTLAVLLFILLSAVITTAITTALRKSGFNPLKTHDVAAASDGLVADGGHAPAPARTDGGPVVTAANPDGGPAPKHRLQIGQYTTADGFRSLVPPYYDTALKMNCQPATDSKGVLRCFPGGNYRVPVYRGVDSKTGECLEEVILSPVTDKTVGSLIGVGTNGAGRLHKVGQKLVGEFVHVKTVDKSGKPICASQQIPQGMALFALGEDVTSGLVQMNFQWVDAP